MKLIKIATELNFDKQEFSLIESFGLIPLSELNKIESKTMEVIKTLDYDDREFHECEGYSEITFEIKWVNNEWQWTTIDSFYYDVN